MHVPVTDAFDESDHLTSQEVELTTKQVEWLEKKADEQGLSLDHMLRSVITAQIRAQSEGMEDPSSSAKGDGSPSAAAQVSADSVAASDRNATDADEDDESDDPSSIVDSLRSASERLQDLTEEGDAAETPDPHDTLQRLQARLGNESDADDEAEDTPHGTVLFDDQSRSMFDMMEED
jgi:hypothetical protein